MVAGLRFHDERNADNLLLGGNYVAFTYRGRRRKCRCRSAAPTARPSATATCCGCAMPAISTPPHGRRLGEIAYTYTFDARSMLFEVEAALDLDPGDRGRGRGPDDRPWRAVVLPVQPVVDAKRRPAALRRRGAVGALVMRSPGRRITRSGKSTSRPMRWRCIRCPLAPQHLAGIETVVATQGQLDRVIARYEFPGRHRGGRLVAAEHKLITAGGFYDRVGDYAALMREASAAMGSQRAACDFSISYDYGATLNALAKCFAVAAAGQAPPEADISPDALRAAFDETLSYYCELYGYRHEIRPERDLFARAGLCVLGVATMFRATGAAEYLRRLVRLCEVLLDFEMPFEDKAGGAASAFLMRHDNRDAAYFDCQSAALLALTQAAAIVEDPAARGRDRARVWRPTALATCAVELPQPYKIDTVAVELPGGRTAGQHHTGFWNFKAGLALRFFAALRRWRRLRVCRRSPRGTPTVLRCSRRSCDISWRESITEPGAMHRNPHLRSFGRDQFRDPALGDARAGRPSFDLIDRAHARHTRPAPALRRAREQKAMPQMPTEALAAAEFIVRHLYRPLEVADAAQFFAVTETEHLVGGDNWFWLDDNAKVLEFMSRPEVWRRYPDADPGDAALRALDVPGAVHVPPGQHAAAGADRRRRRAWLPARSTSTR